MGKSPDAFRTISEVSTWLDTPPHVLRFWESKFLQIKPVKRAGGRRYYRPDDMALLSGIKALLHEQGMTIKGVQKMLRERGPRHVAGLSAMPWAGDAAEAFEGEAIEVDGVGPGVDETGLRLVFDADAGPADEMDDDIDDALEMEAAGEDDVEPAPKVDGVAASSGPGLFGGFIAATLERMAANVDDGAVDGVDGGTAADAPASPATAFEGALDVGADVASLLALIARADPARLRERRGRILPLLARLDALRREDRAQAG